MNAASIEELAGFAAEHQHAIRNDLEVAFAAAGLKSAMNVVVSSETPAADDPSAPVVAVRDDSAEPSDSSAKEEASDDIAETPLASISPLHRGPYLQLLGPVEVRGARGEAPAIPTRPHNGAQ